MKGWLKAYLALIRYFGSLLRSFEMKFFAIYEMGNASKEGMK
jgi:hypothetical protein